MLHWIAFVVIGVVVGLVCARRSPVAGVIAGLVGALVGGRLFVFVPQGKYVSLLTAIILAAILSWLAGRATRRRA